MGRIDGRAWVSVNRFCEISERLDGGFIENVGYDDVSSEGQVKLVDLNIPGKDETPLSLTPILVYPHMHVVWRTPSKLGRVFV